MERRSVVIVFAEVSAEARLRGSDEAEAFVESEAVYSKLVRPKILANEGEVLRHSTNWTLAIFANATSAVETAVEIQQRMADDRIGGSNQRWPFLRIGIHSGDILVVDEDVLGNAVGLAARVLELGVPGAVCLTGAVYDAVRDKHRFAFEKIGEWNLKTSVSPIRVYQMIVEDPERQASSDLVPPISESPGCWPQGGRDNSDLRQEWAAGPDGRPHIGPNGQSDVGDGR